MGNEAVIAKEVMSRNMAAVCGVADAHEVAGKTGMEVGRRKLLKLRRGNKWSLHVAMRHALCLVLVCGRCGSLLD